MIADLEGGGGTLRRVRPHAATAAGTTTSHGLIVPEKCAGCKDDQWEVVWKAPPPMAVWHELELVKEEAGIDVGTFRCRLCGRSAIVMGFPESKLQIEGLRAGFALRAYECTEDKSEGVATGGPTGCVSLTWAVWERPRERFQVPCYTRARGGTWLGGWLL